MKRAIITGICGQDGYYLAKFLLAKNYSVHGFIRSEDWSLRGDLLQLNHDGELQFHLCDLSEPKLVQSLLKEILADEVYHLAGQSSVAKSFAAPEEAAQGIAMGCLRILDSLAQLNHPTRFFNASSAEIFGESKLPMQSEETPLRPNNPYGCAKAFAHSLTSTFRKRGIFAVNGILFNHESTRRSPSFVTRKITKTIAEILARKASELVLGNLQVQRDWGWAEDYVEAMWLTLQHSTAEDFVIATGSTHRLEEFVNLAFEKSGLASEDYLRIDPAFLRPTDMAIQCGDPTKIQTALGWKSKTSFQEIVSRMLEHDLQIEGAHPRQKLQQL